MDFTSTELLTNDGLSDLQLARMAGQLEYLPTNQYAVGAIAYEVE